MNKINKNALYFYTDDSGNDNFSDDGIGFSLCSAVVKGSDVNQIKLEINKFKQKWSSKLDSKIEVLHDCEIDESIRKNTGIYKKLGEDEKFRNEFINELNSLLFKLPFHLLSIGWGQNEYIPYLAGIAQKHYYNQCENISKMSHNQQSFYPLHFICLVREIYILSQTPKYNNFEKYIIYPEYKSSFLEHDNLVKSFVEILSKKRPISIHAAIKKSDCTYPVGIEIADLCANSLRHQMFMSKKHEKQFEIIKDKIILNLKIDSDYYSKFLGPKLTK